MVVRASDRLVPIEIPWGIVNRLAMLSHAAERDWHSVLVKLLDRVELDGETFVSRAYVSRATFLGLAVPCRKDLRRRK
jgi:hypothetical protein